MWSSGQFKAFGQQIPGVTATGRGGQYLQKLLQMTEDIE